MIEKRAINLIRRNVRARAAALDEGLRALGYEILQNPVERVQANDILLIWNRYGNMDRMAQKFEAAGRPVIVVENSYVDMKNTKKSFAMALNHHNGAGHWPIDEARADMLDVNIQPFKRKGKLILVLPQRGIGAEGVAMPKTWPQTIDKKLKALTDRPSYVRRHPGIYKEAQPLEKDFEAAWCAITWGSGAGVKALFAGVPTFCEFPNWIGRAAAHFGVGRLRDITPDQAAALMGSQEDLAIRVASAQWKIEEVATGEPFAKLIELHERNNK